jgi:hypothetical protein
MKGYQKATNHTWDRKYGMIKAIYESLVTKDLRHTRPGQAAARRRPDGRKEEHRTWN